MFADVDPASPLAQEEIFGPVLAIGPFDDEDEAVALANGTRYGLAGYVWTRDLGRAHRVAGGARRRLRLGQRHGEPPAGGAVRRLQGERVTASRADGGASRSSCAPRTCTSRCR